MAGARDQPFFRFLTKTLKKAKNLFVLRNKWFLANLTVNIVDE